ncbi:hypothetical protein LSH36_537g02038, partial [Paralvinella palmiformis]
GSTSIYVSILFRLDDIRFCCVILRYLTADKQANMTLYGITVISAMFGIIFTTGRSDGKIYHHCFYEGGYCGIKNITCKGNKVIDITRSRIYYSPYWSLSGTYTNCTITNWSCYQKIDEPRSNCSGLSFCRIQTCLESQKQALECAGNMIANTMKINYRCIPRNTFTGSRSTRVTLSPTDTSRQTTSDDGELSLTIVCCCQIVLILL